MGEMELKPKKSRIDELGKLLESKPVKLETYTYKLTMINKETKEANEYTVKIKSEEKPKNIKEFIKKNATNPSLVSIYQGKAKIAESHMPNVVKQMEKSNVYVTES
ncbi:hypothetical protein JXB01_00290 [Candidatus Micrarchaeota archaeon]|nr:hypothetical protein [Candidatus Micrarchaeota archaeon]